MRGVLSTSVTVKDEFCFWVSLCPCHFESRCDQLGAVLSGYFVCDNFAGKQIQNHTGVKIELPQLKTSNIADPDLVGLVRLKLLLEDVPFLFRFMKFDGFWYLFENTYQLIVEHPDDSVQSLFTKIQAIPNCIVRCPDFDALSLKYFISVVKDGVQQ